MKKRKLMVLALGWRLLLLLTVLLVVPVGNFGYLNVSDFIIVMVCQFLKPEIGMLYASSATALADIILGYSYFAPYTFVIRALQGWFIGFASKRNINRILIVIMSGCIVLFGYAFAAYFMYGSWQVALLSMRENTIQVGICSVLSLANLKSSETLGEYISKYTE